MNKQIQLITNNHLLSYDWLESNSIRNPMSLDMYELNILDLSDPSIWTYKGSSKDHLNIDNDLNSLKAMFSSSVKSKKIIFLPQNINYQYASGLTIPLKDMLAEFSIIVRRVLPHSQLLSLFYENSVTDVGGVDIDSSFCFATGYSADKILTKAQGSEKGTTIQLQNDIFISTLNVFEQETSLLLLLEELSLLTIEKEQVPEWISSIFFNNDDEQRAIIQENKDIITQAEAKIKSAQEILDSNMELKSILYSNGDELVSVVFRILEHILNCDLSDFKDTKKEDFLIKLDSITFIGEIKGITSNVKNGHLSQLENHYQSYQDTLKENGVIENVKQVLIINPFRNKPIEERDSIHEEQIQLAERYGTCIIETKTLLHLYEIFLKGNVSCSDIKDRIAKCVGVLNINNIKE